MKTITITGPECTGKTTLAASLAEHYATVWVQEQSRIYAERKPGPLDRGDVESIARQQIAAEERGFMEATGLLILDTDLLSTVIYARHYYGQCPEWIAKSSVGRQSDLYLLTALDVPWTADSVRDRGDRREEMFELFRSELASRALPVVSINGSIGDRFRQAVSAIDSFTAEPKP